MYYWQKEALEQRKSHLEFETNRAYDEYMAWKSKLDKVLARLALLSDEETEQGWLGNERQ